MTHGSVFTGIGGFDLASERMGWENVFHCENNRFCREFLQKRFGGISYEDIRTTNFTVWKGRIGILSGGFPCQDTSNAKRHGEGQTGLSGERTGLWWEMARAIDEIKPMFVVAENVADILTVNNGTDFAPILHTLAGLGYNVEWKTIYASDCGFPHRRKRCYMVAYPYSIRLPESESFFSYVSPSIEPKLQHFAGTFIQNGIPGISQPQVCSLDYGFSSRSLEMYGKSRLKEEVFHAYGNAIIPHLAYCIFKKINEVFNDLNYESKIQN